MKFGSLSGISAENDDFLIKHIGRHEHAYFLKDSDDIIIDSTPKSIYNFIESEDSFNQNFTRQEVTEPSEEV